MKNVLRKWVVLAACAWMTLAVAEATAAIVFRAASSAGLRQPTISYRASGTVASAASGNITPTLASVELNALLVCLVEQHDSVTISFPAGWIQLYSISTTATHRASAYYHQSAATETNPLITHSGGNSIIAQCSTFRGADAANPLDVAYAAQYAASSTSVTSGTSVTTLAANDMMLFAPHIANNPTIAAPTGAGGVGWTQRFYSSTASGLHSAVGLYTGTIAAAGTVGPITSTISLASENNGVLMALRNGSRLSIPVPAGTLAGDVMVAAVATTPSSVTITAPVGWTVIQAVTQASNTSNRVSTYYRVAGASEPASYSWGLSTTHTGAAGGIVSYSGVDNTNPMDISAGTATPSSLNHTAPSITTTAAGDMLVTVHEFASSSSWTPPGGMTERVDIASRSPNNTAGVTLEMSELLLPVAGATGTKTATAAANADTGATVSIALRPAVAAPDHIEIDYPAPPFSTCSSTPVTVYACANAACSSYYSGGISVTLSPGAGVVNIPSGSGSGSGTVFQTTAGAATLGAVSTPGAVGATTCKNTSTGTFSCSASFSASSLTVTVPNLTAGTTVAGTVSGCLAQVPVGANTVNFYTAYNNPASGTLQANINGTAISPAAGAGTPITLNFSAISGSTNQATFNFSYPDVGLLSLNACKPNCTAPTASGNDPVTAAPDHFVISGINCVSGCTVGTNPAAASAAGSAFMKSGNPFSLTVTAYNGAATPAVTPNFGKESTPEKITLAPTVNMPDLPGAIVGNVICSATQPGTTTCITGAGIATVADVNGAGAVNARVLYDEAGIMTLGAKLASGNYLGSGLKEITIPSSGNIGRFIPDHFTVTTDADGPIATRSDYPPQAATTVSVAAGVGATTITVAATTGFNVGDKIRIYAGTGFNAFTSTVSAVGASTLTLSAGIGTALAVNDNVIDEWGSYSGERMDAQFALNAVEFGGSVTNNYQGIYAKLNPAAAGNPLGIGAVDTVAPTYNLALDTSLTATGSFASGIATITAPIAVVRGASATAPYTSVQIGIAPTTAEADGVRMGTYNLGVTSATSDHTSIMDPFVQASTEVRFGRLKLSNAVGSEKSALQIPVQAQYWSGNAWVLNANDSLTQIPATSAALSNYRDKSGTPPTPNWTTTPTGLGTLLGGQGTITLSAPAPAGGTGSVDLAINLGTATTDISCLASHPVMTAPALSLAYLRGMNGSCAAASTYAADPSATATFGVYVPESRKAVHIRELF